MRLLFATTGGAGHFLPLVPLARAARDAGHDVLVAGHPGAAQHADREGLPFRPLPEAPQEAIDRFRAGQEGLDAMQAVQRAFLELFVGIHGRAALPGMLAVTREWRPDVIVRETAELSSMVAAEAEGVPMVEVAIGLSSAMGDRIQRLAIPAVDELRDLAGIAHAETKREWSVMTMAPLSLDAGGVGSPSVLRFRPPVARAPVDLPPAPASAQHDPLVYVSFGTEVPSRTRDYFPQLYRTVVDSLAELPVRALVAIGTQRDPEELGSVPATVRVESWVPQAEALRDAALTVSHGGAGSTLAALAAGVPMVVVPLFADQPLNARTVHALGAGVALDPAHDLTGSLQVAVRRLLEEPRFTDTAQALSEEIAGLPPVEDAVRALERVAAQGALAA